MPTANAAIQPTDTSSGRLVTLTRAPQKPLTDQNYTRSETPGAVASQAQTYMGRIRNYVPVEVIGFFIFCNAMISEGEDGSLTGPNSFVAIASVVVGLLAVIIFAKMANANANAKAATEVWLVQAVVSCVAFFTWVYAMGAEAVELLLGQPEPIIAAFLLGTFSLFSGLIVSVKKLDKTKKFVQEATTD